MNPTMHPTEPEKAQPYMKTQTQVYTVEYDTRGIDNAPIRNRYGQWECRKCAERWARTQEAGARKRGRTLNARLYTSSAPMACACYCEGDSARRMEQLCAEAGV